MHLDGRVNPLELIAQGLALLTVLTVAAVTWLRHDPIPDPPVPTFREVRDVTGPGPWRP